MRILKSPFHYEIFEGMNYNERKKLAQELIRQDKYADAIIEYSNLFTENPKDLENLEQFVFLFGRIMDGNYDFEPQTSDQYRIRGIAKFYRNEIENSIKDYDKALMLNSNHDYALKSRAFSLKSLGRIEDAIADLNKAIKINPRGEYYDDLAELYAPIDIQVALGYHQKAVEYSPDEARLWYNYGVDLMDNQQYKEAFSKYEKAIELWPEYEDAIVNRKYLLENFRDEIG